MRTIIVASQNNGKLAEIKDILGKKFNIISMAEAGITVDIEETGTTFEENALIKAREVNRLSGEWSLSDDSGLCVNALGGAPGVYSARYCGSHGKDDSNNALLLQNMTGTSDRSAYYACSMVLVKSPASYISGYGEVHGKILSEGDGDGGFGYDPLFYCDELKMSFGKATPLQKNKISHRFRALNDLFSKIK